VLSFELGLLWPGFMGYAGSIIGMPFSLEGFAFFTEAIFLGSAVRIGIVLLHRVHVSNLRRAAPLESRIFDCEHHYADPFGNYPRRDRVRHDPI
jgi:hypothetical protein